MTTTGTRRVLVDVSQVLLDPRASGIHRVLAHLVDTVDPDGVTLEPAALLEGRYVTVSRRHASTVLHGGFVTRGERSAALRAALVDDWEHQALREVRVEEMAERAEGYLLPEPTSVPEVLAGARQALRSGLPTMFLYYDSLPLLHPELFHGPHAVPLNEYFVLATEVEHVAFVSEAAREEFEHRVRRSPVPHSVVAHPGVAPEELPEGEASTPPQPPHFVCLGAVEPRRRTDAVVTAFERLRAGGTDARLTVVGRPTSDSEAFNEPLRRKARDGVFTWHRGMHDVGVARLVRSATALVFPSEHEGYGLPPLEALALGTPVVTSAVLPSLEAVSGAGQVRLDRVDEASLLQAMTDLARPEVAARLRAAVDVHALPTWDGFARALEAWVASSLRAAA